MKKTLITNDIIKLVKSSKGEIKEYDLDRYIQVTVGKITITKGVGSKPVLNLESGCDQEYMMLWNNDIGRLFLNEIKKDNPKVYELIDDKFKALLVLADEDEYGEFASKNFLHVTFGDNKYTIIKVVRHNENYSTIERHNDYFGDIDGESIVDDVKTEEDEPEKLKETELF